VMVACSMHADRPLQKSRAVSKWWERAWHCDSHQLSISDQLWRLQQQTAWWGRL